MAHEMFTATNRRSGNTYRVDSLTFPAGYYTDADTPHNTTRWTFQVEPDRDGVRFAETAAAEWRAALAVSGTKARP